MGVMRSELRSFAEKIIESPAPSVSVFCIFPSFADLNPDLDILLFPFELISAPAEGNGNAVR
jgi:hypothetical protein